MDSSVDRSEIAFFDLETTVPTRPGQGFAILEFGSILVCPRKLVELGSYQTLVRPHDLSLISTLSTRANGITADAVISAPTFLDVADAIYDILHGRVWAGHNIVRFDCVRLSEAYAQINRLPPEPKGTIDSLDLLTHRFGRRAGDMKMASLGAYFGLGQQTHRSLDDVRMNFEVLKCCATVLFLESILPDIFLENSWVSPNQVEYGSAQTDPFDMCPLVDTMERGALQSNEAMQEEPSASNPSDPFSEHTEFLAPDEVSIASITVAVAPFYHGSQRIQLLHRDTTMQLRCDGMRVRFGLSKRFVAYDGRPRLSFVVDASSANLCAVLDACDNIVKRSVYADSNSEWRPVVSRKVGFYNSPTIRLHLPTVAGYTVEWITEVYHKESSSLSSSSTQGPAFSSWLHLQRR